MISRFDPVLALFWPPYPQNTYKRYVSTWLNTSNTSQNPMHQLALLSAAATVVLLCSAHRQNLLPQTMTLSKDQCKSNDFIIELLCILSNFDDGIFSVSTHTSEFYARKKSLIFKITQE